MEFIKSEYRKQGFLEVITPNIYNSQLWVTSGHWQHYSKNMSSFEVEKEQFALKPMNCLGHCLMFDHRPRSWRELPLWLADLGVLHRNELSCGHSRDSWMQRFQHDDAHIFCTMEQIVWVFCIQYIAYLYFLSNGTCLLTRKNSLEILKSGIKLGNNWKTV
ncbi:hypothetical protein HJG60_011223 [Phyllostomus discolor]|uniref:threonine--tRNA ligase n=1 Tax=Phyllostomus discolor TaxID=89673 RepID=A0A834E551_9CHIR|nr:hypothetical protein HJG60_011223 [Phyllostomus discolor]